MSKQILISIGAGRYQKGVIQVAQDLGYHVVAVDIDPKAVSLQYADQVVIVDAHNADKTLAAIQIELDVSQVVGVVTQAARACITTTAAVAQALGCLHLDLHVATQTLQKNKLIQKFHPDVILGTLDHPEANLRLQYPLLVKSDEGSGSTGIGMMNSQLELQNFLKADNQKFPIICHRYLQGRHFGILGIATQAGYHIYGILEQFLDDTLHIMKTCFPADLSDTEVNNLTIAAQTYLKEIGFNLGPFQVEVILEDDGSIYLAEIEASIIGSYVSERMIPEAGENNFIHDSIMTLTKPGFTPSIVENKFQVTNEFPYTPSNPGEDHKITHRALTELVAEEVS